MDFGPGQPNIAKIAKFPQQLGNLGNLGNLGPEDAGSPSEERGEERPDKHKEHKPTDDSDLVDRMDTMDRIQIGQVYPVNSVHCVQGIEAAAARLVVDSGEMDQVLDSLESCSAVGIDIETTGLNPRQDRIRLLSLSVGDRVYVIDSFAVNPSSLFPALTTKELVGHNLLFDLQFLAQLGFVPAKAFDTMLASQVLTAGQSVKHNLKDVAQRYLGIVLDKTEQQADWAGPLTEDMIRYAALDAAVPLRLREVMLSRARRDHLETIIDLENRCLLAVVSMSRNGVGFDADTWRQLAEEAEQERQELQERMNALVPSAEHLFGPEGINWNSPEQVQTAFARLGVCVGSTSDEALAGIAHPLARLLREYRSASKRVSAYGTEWMRYVENGRIYPTWRQCSTRSGRMSCSNPNMQQLPRDARYRRCFRAAPGHVLIKADYSQIELRLAAKIANEERMIAAYRKGDDIHTLTARTLTGQSEVSKADRQLAKAINFGLLYGMGARSLAQYAQANYGVTLTDEEAAQHRRAFFRLYPGLARWHRRQAGRSEGRAIETRTLLGRRRLAVARYTEKLNTPVQGSGADGLKAALALCWERRSECPSARLVLAVHDEIVIEVPEDNAHHAQDWLIRCMLDGMQPLLDPVPCVVEATIVTTWGG
jgi:DNA polymerase-1